MPTIEIILTPGTTKAKVVTNPTSHADAVLQRLRASAKFGSLDRVNGHIVVDGKEGSGEHDFMLQLRDAVNFKKR